MPRQRRGADLYQRPDQSQASNRAVSLLRPGPPLPLVGTSSSTAVMEKIYRHELRPVIETTATAMDQVFSLGDVALGWHMQPLFGVHEAEG